MIGILNAYLFDTDPASYQKEYGPMCAKYLEKVLPGHKIKSFLVAQGNFPSHIDECDGYVITGSPASCYDPDKWIQDLIAFIRECHERQKKILGLCFGHQIIAYALGGVVVKSEKGWGVGVMPMQLVSKKSWISPQGDSNTFSILYSHQDQVTSLPVGANLLAVSDFCPISAFSIDDHIFTMQGHPEFTRDFAKSRYDTRIHLLGPDAHAKAIESMQTKTDEDLIGQWIYRFFS